MYECISIYILTDMHVKVYLRATPTQVTIKSVRHVSRLRHCGDRSRREVKVPAKFIPPTPSYPGMDGAHAEPKRAARSWETPVKLSGFKKVKSNSFNLPEYTTGRRQRSASVGGAFTSWPRPPRRRRCAFNTATLQNEGKPAEKTPPLVNKINSSAGFMLHHLCFV